MNILPDALQTDQPTDQSDSQNQTTEKPVPIEVKWNIPAWMMCDPGPAIAIEDDDIDFQ